MVLEVAHRPFKQWLEDKSYAGAKITEFARTMLRDWLGRVQRPFRQWEGAIEECQRRAETGLLRVLLGDDELQLDRQNASTAVLLQMSRGTP